jgi:DNA-binding transcriptional ArsR family regulator
MVKYMTTTNLDHIFGSLADPTRRDIISRLAQNNLTVSQIAADYDISLPAISKHLKVLLKASLIIKRRKGKQQMISLAPQALADAAQYLDWYRQFTDARYDSLESYLNKEV